MDAPKINYDALARVAPRAIIYVNGNEVRRCYDGDDYDELFRETVETREGKVALCVYKACFGGYRLQRKSVGKLP